MSSHISNVHIREHTRQDVAAPATAALLRFFVNFAKEEKPYFDAIQDLDGKVLWGIGQKALVRPCTPPPSSSSDSGDSGDTDDDIPDESAQDETAYINMINGPALQAVDPRPTVTIVGAGMSGLVAAYELRRAQFNVRILEASSRVGGRVVTFRDPVFAPGLHAEGGAMRIPKNHFLLHAYIDLFNIDSLFPFEMKNKFIYLSGYQGGTTLTYDNFNDKLINKEAELLKLFPGLKDNEKGKTCDQLFFEAVEPVVALFKKWYQTQGDESTRIHVAYQKVTEVYDKYTLRSYLQEVAEWSNDALSLFDLGNAHVVFENGFIESWKDAFLSSNSAGGAAGMEQPQNGMDQIPKAFISPDRKWNTLAGDITYGARVTNLADINPAGDVGPKVRVDYETDIGTKLSVTSDFVILAVPYTAQRAITKSRAFSPALEQAIRDVRYIQITKILLQYQSRWWDDVFWDHGQGTDGGLISDLPIRYTMFPVTKDNSQFKNNTERAAIMAAYTFQQDATILGAMTEEHRVRTAAENLDHIFPAAKSLELLEAGTSQAFPSDEMAGGSAFCYFGPGQKTQYLETMRTPDWAFPEGSTNYRVFFAGEHASYTHGWIHGAIEAGLRCVQQVHTVATSRPSRRRS